MKLSNILTLPAHYKDRISKVNEVSISNFVLDLEKDQINCSCRASNKYTTRISFLDIKEILSNSPIQVDCNCQSFTFEFAHAVGLDNGLLFPDNFPNLAAKNKNKYSYLSSCKHLIKFAQFIFHRSVLINNEVNGRLKK